MIHPRIFNAWLQYIDRWQELIDLAEIHRKLYSTISWRRKRALVKLCDNFTNFPDKIKAWEVLIRFIQDEEFEVSYYAKKSLNSLLTNVPDKQKAWDIVIRRIRDKNCNSRYSVVYILGVLFSHVPNKEQAWEDLHQLTQDDDYSVRSEVTKVLTRVFFHLPDKKQAWEDMHRLTQDDDGDVQKEAAIALGRTFPHIPEKEQAWKDLQRLAQNSLWTQEQAVIAIGKAFSYIPDKTQAWKFLHQLIRNKSTQEYATIALGLAFSHIPYKEKAWKDLQRLTKEDDGWVREEAAIALGRAFSYLSDKEEAWLELIRLTKDNYSDVRNRAADALGFAFYYVPNKNNAWLDLLRLIQEGDWYMREKVAYAIGANFPYIPNKDHAWYCLTRLAQDNDTAVRVFANHSLGRVSIFKATETESEEDYGKEIEKAIGFFECSSKEARIFLTNPAQFCLPFYRSFYMITFNKQEAEAEVQKYLAEARRVVKGSKNKEMLIEAVENLANALKEVQKARDFYEKKSDLNTYRHYCERAADLLDTIEGKAPITTKLIRKGLPIINKEIKELLSEINKNTQIFCDSTKGTKAEKFTNPICKEIKQIIKTKNPIELEKRINGLLPNLNFMAEKFSEKERNFVNIKVENIRKEEYLEDKLVSLNEIIIFVTPYINLAKDNDIHDKLDEIINLITLGTREELVISVGVEFIGTGAKHEIHIPLQEITYPDIKKDLENIKGKTVLKLTSLPVKLASKVRDYLIQNKNDLDLKFLKNTR